MNEPFRLNDRVEPEGFHAVCRAPIRSEVTIKVEYEGVPREVALEIGLGEPSTQVSVLRIDRDGTFRVPRVVDKDELISVRYTKLPHRRPVTITPHFELAP
jgi:hypothetical protein